MVCRYYLHRPYSTVTVKQLCDVQALDNFTRELLMMRNIANNVSLPLWITETGNILGTDSSKNNLAGSFVAGFM